MILFNMKRILKHMTSTNYDSVQHETYVKAYDIN